jgi:hypothetical protein
MCEDVHCSYSTQIIWILGTVKFCLSGTHRTGYMPDNWVFQIIRQHLYWPKLLLVTFCYCFYTWAAQLIRGVFNWDISFICWFKVIRALFCVKTHFPLQECNFTAQEVDGAGDKTSWNTTTFNAETFFEAYLNMSVRSAYFSDKVFLENAKILVLELLSSSAGISGFPKLSDD